MSTTTTTTPATIPTDTEAAAATAQDLARLRRHRAVFFLLFGAVLTLGAALLAKVAPSWADAMQVAFAAGGPFAAAIPLLFARR
ncbi:hypothetical protein [Streptomyces sp. NPDC029003]|uniref:hypothetical protein n=1 Tax=Streptomyces sp. NPDC029003 TaxID=3155125 RepID=UPI0033FCA84A